MQWHEPSRASQATKKSSRPFELQSEFEFDLIEVNELRLNWILNMEA